MSEYSLLNSLNRLFGKKTAEIHEYTHLFAQNTAEITGNNLKILCLSSFGLVIVMIAGSISCLLISEARIRFSVYIIDTAVFLFIGIASLFKTNKNSRFVISSIIIQENVLLATSLILDVFLKNRNFPATVFLLGLVLASFFYIVIPVYHQIMMSAWTFLFITADVLIKTHDAFLYDIINILAIYLACSIVGDITNKARIAELETKRRLIFQRDTDILTLLPNRRKLFETLRGFSNPEGTDMLKGLIMADIDYFKQYNDTFGHQSGDLCLQTLGQCMAGLGSDYGIQFYRYGGEEFAGIITDNSHGGSAAADELVKRISKLNIAGSELSIDGRITISCGYAYLTQCPVPDYETLIRLADEALYAAKEAGRNRAAAYKSSTDETLLYMQSISGK